MRTQKGITLISLIIYMITMCLVLAILAIIVTFFFNNKKIITEQSEYIAEYNKFNMFFIEDVKNNTKAKVLLNETELGEEQSGNSIVFDDGNIYTFVLSDKGICRNKVKICENVENCAFSIDTITDNETGSTKKVVQVTAVIKDSSVFSPTNEYVLKYW